MRPRRQQRPAISSSVARRSERRHSAEHERPSEAHASAEPLERQRGSSSAGDERSGWVSTSTSNCSWQPFAIRAAATAWRSAGSVASVRNVISVGTATPLWREAVGAAVDDRQAGRPGEGRPPAAHWTLRGRPPGAGDGQRRRHAGVRAPEHDVVRPGEADGAALGHVDVPDGRAPAGRCRRCARRRSGRGGRRSRRSCARRPGPRRSARRCPGRGRCGCRCRRARPGCRRPGG